MPQQVDDFLEGGVLRQSMDVVTPITENALVAVDVTDLGFAGDDAFKPAPVEVVDPPAAVAVAALSLANSVLTSVYAKCASEIDRAQTPQVR